ncbi:MAG: phosphate ABC transporter permease PstA [bacterium]
MDSTSLPLKSLSKRYGKDRILKGLSALSALLGLFMLAWILYEVILHGAKALNWSFFTKLPTPPGMEGGGLANAILGTGIMTVLAAILGTPIGILTGVYLAEFGGNSRWAEAIRFITNLLIGIPSIIVGVFIYILIVVPTKSFSGYAGAVSLAVIMLPVVVRTTEDMLNMVPYSLREAGLSLGAPRWKITLGVVFRAARSGLLTGVLLALARISGETAPLLFTALNSPYWMHSLHEPTANLTVSIFNYAMSPFADWQAKAWGASLLIMVAVLLLTIFSRILLLERKRSK